MSRETCPACHGDGWRYDDAVFHPCVSCRGTGRVLESTFYVCEYSNDTCGTTPDAQDLWRVEL